MFNVWCFVLGFSLTGHGDSSLLHFIYQQTKCSWLNFPGSRIRLCYTDIIIGNGNSMSAFNLTNRYLRCKINERRIFILQYLELSLNKRGTK